MPKFRKKPVVIEAMQWLGPVGRCEEDQALLDWMGRESEHHMPEGCWLKQRRPGWPFSLMVNTLEGDMEAGPGDWIIKGVNGEFYPCKPDIFEKTYEPAE